MAGIYVDFRVDEHWYEFIFIFLWYLRTRDLPYYLQAHPNPSGNWSEWLVAKLHLPNPMAENIPNKPLDYYTCPFKTSKLDR